MYCVAITTWNVSVGYHYGAINIYYILCLKKNRPEIFHNNLTTTVHAERIAVQLPTNCVWKVWYWSRTIYAVSIETVAPLQTAAKCEEIKWCWIKKVVGLFWFNMSNYQTRNSVVADKRCNAFVQMQRRGWRNKTRPFSCYHTNLVILGQTVYA